MLIRSAVGEPGVLWTIGGSLILASEGWKPSPLSLIVWPWAGHPLHVNFLTYFQIEKVILTSQVFNGDKIKQLMPMLCTLLSRMLLLGMRTCKPSCEFLNVPIKDSTLGQRVPGCGPGYWSVLSFTDIRQTHPVVPYISALTSSSHGCQKGGAASCLLFCSEKEREGKERRKKNLFF